MENLGAGLRLTVYGMGIVFLLLGVLALIIAGLVRLDRPRAQQKPAKPEAARPAPDAPDPALLAAIMIAVRAHIRVRRKQAAPAMRSHQPGTLPSRWVASGRTRQNRSWAPGGRYV
ncbi:MAG TPA: OadG family protein [Vicinamibacteria bacterium]